MKTAPLASAHRLPSPLPYSRLLAYAVGAMVCGWLLLDARHQIVFFN